jgi:hypothetical protein
MKTTDQNLPKISSINHFMYQTKSVSSESTPSGIDSISTTYIEKQKGLRILTQQRKIEEEKKVKKRSYSIFLFRITLWFLADKLLTSNRFKCFSSFTIINRSSFYNQSTNECSINCKQSTECLHI